MTKKQGGALHPLPIRTFGEVAALGLEVEVCCASCHHVVKVDPSDVGLRDRQFAGARFRCAAVFQRYTASPPETCNSVGHIHIKPPVLLPVGGPVTLAFLYCATCLPPWQIDQARLDQPPWSLANLQPGDRFRCPGCRRAVSWHIHGPAWRPSYGCANTARGVL